MYQRILAAIDGSETSNAGARHSRHSEATSPAHNLSEINAALPAVT